MSGGLFDTDGQSISVPDGYFGDAITTTVSLEPAIVDDGGTPRLVSNITAREITDLLNIDVADIVDNGDNTYTVTKTDGTTFTITAGGGSGGNDPRLFIQDPQPATSSPEGSIWIDTGDTPHTINILNSGVWIEFEGGAGITSGTTLPTTPTPTVGDVFLLTAVQGPNEPGLYAYLTDEDGSNDWQYQDRGGTDFSLTTQYYSGDIVVSNAAQWQAIAARPVLGTRPETSGNTDWKLLIDNAAVGEGLSTTERVNETTAYSKRSIINRFAAVERPTFRGEWSATASTSYQQFDVVLDGHTGSLFQLEQASVPTADISNRPSLARRDTNGAVLWALVSDVFHSSFSDSQVYDEGDLVLESGVLYLKIQDGQTAGAGTALTNTNAWLIIRTGTGGAGDPERGGILWDANTQYAIGDIISYIGFTFQVTEATPGSATPPTMGTLPRANDGSVNPGFKVLINNDLLSVSAGTIEDQSTAPSRAIVRDAIALAEVGGRVFSSTRTYITGDVVSFNNNLYINLTGTTGTDPSTDTTNWMLVETGGSGGLTVEDEGTVLGAIGTVDTLNFEGAGVFARRTGNEVTISISGEPEVEPTLGSFVTGGAIARFQNPANQSRTVTFTASTGSTFTTDSGGALTNFVLAAAPAGVTYGTPTINGAETQVSVVVTVNSQTRTSDVGVAATASLEVTSSGSVFTNRTRTATVQVRDQRVMPSLSPTSFSRSVFDTGNASTTVTGRNTAAIVNAGQGWDITNTVNWSITGGSGATGDVTLSNGSATQVFPATQLLTTTSQATLILFNYNESNPRLNGQTGIAATDTVSVSFFTPWYYSSGVQPTAVTGMTERRANFASSQTQRIDGTVGDRVWVATTASSINFLLGASTTPGANVGTLTRANAAGTTVTFNLFRGPQLAAASSNFTITT